MKKHRNIRLRKRKGFSIAEVSISFLLLLFVILMIGHSMVSSYIMTMKAREIVSQRTEAMNRINDKTAKLEESIQSKNQAEKELDKSINTETILKLSNSIKEYKNEIDNIQLSNYECELFGEKFTNYILVGQDEKGIYTFTTAVPSKAKLTRSVPILNSINIPGEDSDRILYQDDDSIQCKVKYEDKNHEYLSKTLYKWYASNPGFHVMYSKGDILGVEDSANLYADLSKDYYSIQLDTGKGFTETDSLKITDELKGKLVICAATPLSSEGAMGETLYSDPVYISAAPIKDIMTLLDPSMELFSEDDLINDEEMMIESKLDSFSNQFISEGTISGTVNISLYGESIIGDCPKTRYISLKNDEEIEYFFPGDDGEIANSHKIAMVIRESNADIEKCVSRTPGSEEEETEEEETEDTFSWTKNIFTSNGEPASEWYILTGTIPNNTESIQIGNTEVDIAEMVILESGGDIDNVIKYLKDKYYVAEGIWKTEQFNSEEETESESE